MTLRYFAIGCCLAGSALVLAEPSWCQGGRQAAASTRVGRIRWRAGDVDVPRLSEAEKLPRLQQLVERGLPVHLVVQLDRPVTDALRADLRGKGLELQQPLANDAFYALLEPSTEGASRLASQTEIAWVDRLRGEWKLHPELLSQAPPPWSIVEGRGTTDPRIAVEVVLHPDASRSEIKEILEGRVGARVVSELRSIDVLNVLVDLSKVRSIAELEGVQWIEPPMPPLSAASIPDDVSRWRMGIDEISEAPYGLDGSGVRILVYDEGEAWDQHPDLVGHVFVRDLFLGHTDHPTKVSGVIVGNGASFIGSGLVPIVGIAPAAQVDSYSVDATPSSEFVTGSFDIEADYSDGLNVLGDSLANTSLGTNLYQNHVALGYPCSWYGDYGVSAALLDSIARGSLGSPFLAVWGVGNERTSANSNACLLLPGYSSVAPPAGAKNHIAVGISYGLSDSVVSANDYGSGSFDAARSSWGPTDDGRLKPDVVAPGYAVESTSYTPATGNVYSPGTGSSLSAPQVTGVCALLLQDYRAQFPGRSEPRPSSYKALLAQTAKDIMAPGPDYMTGFGSVRAKPAVDLQRAGARGEFEVAQGQEVVLSASIAPGARELRTTIAWDDPAAAPSVVNTLINDLDLIVIDPLGVRHYPWTLDPANPAAQAVRTQEDHVNNIEQVWVPDPIPGLWAIKVRGTSVPSGPQVVSVCAPSRLYGWFVDDDAVGPVHDGRSPATAFLSIPAAIAAAADGDTILVLPGRYAGPVDFQGKDVHVASSGGAAETEIDAQQAGTCVNFLGGEGPRAVLEGFRITGGSAANVGGIRVVGSSPTVKNCVLAQNEATLGGGIYCGAASAPTFEDCKMRQNQATSGGGIFVAAGASPTIRSCTVHENAAQSDGGGLASEAGATVELEDVRLTDNTAVTGGGARLASTSGTLESVTLSGNQASTGGGIYLAQCTGLVLNHLTASANAATGIGGGITIEGGAPTLAQVISVGNGAMQGAGLALYSTSAVVTNTLVAGNISTGGGAGILCSAGSPTLTHLTITANSGASGGGLFCNLNTTPALTNSIVWGNSAASGPGVFVASGSPSITNSDIQGGWAGAGNLNADPLFVDSAGGDFHLQQASPCQNAGTAAASAIPSVDFEGDPRIAKGAPDQGFDEHAFFHVPGEYASLQTAVNAAPSGTTILVGPGTYNLGAPWGAYEPSLQIIDKDILLKSTAGAASTILRGGAFAAVVLLQDVDSTGGLDGFTITNLNPQSGGIETDRTVPLAGGVCAPIIQNCVISGIDCFFSPVIIDGRKGLPLLINNVITGNAGVVGGVYISPSSPGAHVIGNTISGNVSRGVQFGTIYAAARDVLIEGNVIVDNTVNPASASYAYNGGGIYVYRFTAPVIRGNRIARNQATSGAGIYCEPDTAPLIEDNIIDSNRAVSNGANAGIGGGIHCLAAQCAYLNGNTIYGNTADVRGGGVSLQADYSGQAACNILGVNNIVWGNTAPDGPQIGLKEETRFGVFYWARADMTWSDVQGAWPGIGNLSADPLFLNATAADFTLASGSPCIDTGNPVLLDQDGTRSDMGAEDSCLTPTISSVFPVWAGARGGTRVTITGSGFTRKTAVRFGDVPARSVSLVNSTTLEAVTPSFDIPDSPSIPKASRTGVTVDVTVSNTCAEAELDEGISFVRFPMK